MSTPQPTDQPTAGPARPPTPQAPTGPSPEPLVDASAGASDPAPWTARVRASVQTIIGEEPTAALDQQWADRTHVEGTDGCTDPGTIVGTDAGSGAGTDAGSVTVALVGPFNAGKSSLIRRLLVDEGVAVPACLTVNARPETTQVQPVAGRRLTFVDTPGLHSGNPEHDSAAEAALITADAVVVMIPPQVVRQYVTWIRSVCDGTRWVPAVRQLFPTGALLVVIGRADAFGLDPEDSLQEFQDLCQGKIAELEAALALPQEGTRPTFLVVAQDPYAATGEERQPRREAYDAARAWDGMATLQEHLDALPLRVTVLRSAASIRFWAAAGSAALAEGQTEAATLHGLVTESDLRERRLAQSRAALAAVGRAARADLVARLESELSAAYLRSPGTGAGPAQRLEDCVTDWAKEHHRRIAEVARTVEQDLDARQPTLSVRALDAWISRVTGQDGADSTDGSQAMAILKQLSPHTKDLVEAQYSLRLGMTRDTAKKLIESFEKTGKAAADGNAASVAKQLGDSAARMGETAASASGSSPTRALRPLARLRSTLAQRGSLDSPEQVARAKALLNRSDVTVQFLTVLGLVGPPVLELVQDHRAARKEAAERSARAAEGRALVHKIVPEIMGSAQEPRSGWEGMLADLQDALTITPEAAAAVQVTRERLDQVERTCKELTRLLEETPAV